MYKLVIVESPGKVPKIQTILGNEYKVMSSNMVGHDDNFYQDLINRGFIESVPNFDENKYNLIMNELLNGVIGASNIFLAMDDDIFGEKVVSTLVDKLGLSNYKRIHFDCITSECVLNAVR